MGLLMNSFCFPSPLVFFPLVCPSLLYFFGLAFGFCFFSFAHIRLILPKRIVIFALLCFWVNFLAGSDIFFLLALGL